MNPTRKNKKKGAAKTRTPREYAQALLGRDDLSSIGQLGLWSAFANEQAVRRFAALSKAERRAFFARYANTMGENSPRQKNTPSPPMPKQPLAEDYRLFDLLPQANLDQIHSRYRELAFSFHPDRCDGDTELMQEINDAYQRLQKHARSR